MKVGFDCKILRTPHTFGSYFGNVLQIKQQPIDSWVKSHIEVDLSKISPTPSLVVVKVFVDLLLVLRGIDGWVGSMIWSDLLNLHIKGKSGFALRILYNPPYF